MRREAWQYLTLVLILLVAAVFRFYGLAWDSGYLFHPDERKIMLVVSGLHLPSSVFEFFSTDSPLNPKFFAYGSFPIYLLKALSVFTPTLSFSVPWREDFVSLAMFGRVLSVLFDLGTIGFIFLIGRRLYAATVGLLAAACVAITTLHIQLSHFYAVDTLLTLLTTVTFFFAARYAQMGKRRDAILIGVTYGLALATKVTALPLIVPIVVAVVLTADHRPPTADPSSRFAAQDAAVGRLRSAVALVRTWVKQIWAVRPTLAKILGVALAVFVITQPYMLLDPIRYFGQVGTELLVARGWLDFPYTRQYAGTLPLVYPIVQSSVWGMGLPFGIFVWGASAVFAWNWWRKRDWQSGLVLSWALIYFLATGAQFAKYLRYLLPLLPFLFLMTSAYVSCIILRLRAGQATHASHIPHASRVLVFTVYCLLFTGLIYSLAFVSMYSRQHPWITISQWIYTNVPPQSTLAIEHWDDALPQPMRNAEMGERSPTEYRTQILPMYDDDDSAKLDKLVDIVSSSDYVVLATQRLSATITRLPHRYPMSSRYYHLLFSGQLGFDLVASATNGIALDGIVIVDDRFDGTMPPLFSHSDAVVWNWGRADESFTVYDHPLPLVFKKVRTLSPDEIRNLLR
ncbi:MAG: glycosyltransferase family 39 protein [Chloroflexi bacterium]|nr:glycosyltransferase family 39 protein [Chloroflexota bacterium]